MIGVLFGYESLELQVYKIFVVDIHLLTPIASLHHHILATKSLQNRRIISKQIISVLLSKVIIFFTVCCPIVSQNDASLGLYSRVLRTWCNGASSKEVH